MQPSSRAHSAIVRGHSSRAITQLMSRRYEQASTVLTSNNNFAEWGEIFGDEVMAAAPVDRLVRHCHVVNIRGDSYRLGHHPDLRSGLTPREERCGGNTRRRHGRREAPAT